MVISQVSLCSFCRRRILEYVRLAVYCRDRETRGRLARTAAAWTELARAVNSLGDTSSVVSRAGLWDSAIRLSFHAQPACVSRALSRLAK